MKIWQPLETPWKITNELGRYLIYMLVRIQFLLNRITWQSGWKIYGIPILQIHRGSNVKIGRNLQLRSWARANPLGANRPVVICTWNPGAFLYIGDNFGMTGGTICVAESIIIGNRVLVGANSIIVDTDFHPIHFAQRVTNPQEGKTATVYIEDDVFIGMNCMILKGVRLGKGCVVGAGSVVVRDVPPNSIVAGNPATIVSY